MDDEGTLDMCMSGCGGTAPPLPTPKDPIQQSPVQMPVPGSPDGPPVPDAGNVSTRLTFDARSLRNAVDSIRAYGEVRRQGIAAALASLERAGKLDAVSRAQTDAELASTAAFEDLANRIEPLVDRVPAADGQAFAQSLGNLARLGQFDGVTGAEILTGIAVSAGTLAPAAADAVQATIADARARETAAAQRIATAATAGSLTSDDGVDGLFAAARALRDADDRIERVLLDAAGGSGLTAEGSATVASALDAIDATTTSLTTGATRVTGGAIAVRPDIAAPPPPEPSMPPGPATSPSPTTPSMMVSFDATSFDAVVSSLVHLAGAMQMGMVGEAGRTLTLGGAPLGRTVEALRILVDSEIRSVTGELQYATDDAVRARYQQALDTMTATREALDRLLAISPGVPKDVGDAIVADISELLRTRTPITASTIDAFTARAQVSAGLAL